MLRSLGIVVLLLLSLGCPELDTTPIPTKCVKQFEKCKLPTGPLGVCASTPCKDGENAPCFKCVSQH